MPTNRRELLALTALTAPTWLLTPPARASAASTTETLDVPERLREHIATLFGDTPIPLTHVQLELPALAENGNSVALGVRVNTQAPIASTQGGKTWLQKVYVFAEKNPLPDILRYEYPEPESIATANSNEPEIAETHTRIRLSDSQRIIAVAQYSDGSLAAGEASIVVTLAACIDLTG